MEKHRVVRSLIARLFGTSQTSEVDPAAGTARRARESEAAPPALQKHAQPLRIPEGARPPGGLLELTLEEAIAEVKAGRRDTFEIRFLARERERKQQLGEETAEIDGRLEQVVTGRLRATGRLEHRQALRLTLP